MRIASWNSAGMATVVAASLGLLAESVEARQSGPTLEQVFADPPIAARPHVRWWWPGNAVADPELEREIALFREVGFGGAEIQAFNTGVPNLTRGEVAAINTYASPEFFAHVRTSAAAARAQGLTIDYTLGSSWPSGGGMAITPELAMMELVTSVTEIKGPAAGAVKIALPKQHRRLAGAFATFGKIADEAKDWPERAKARSKLIAVIAMKGSGPALKPAAQAGDFKMYSWRAAERSGTVDPASAIDLTGRLREDGTLDWSPPPGTWQVVAFRQFVADTMVGGAANVGPQLVLDHMNQAAFAAHVGRVADPLLDADGKMPAGIGTAFVDSLELFQDIPWTDGFLDAFQARRGYDLRPYLPLIIQPGWKESWGGVGPSAPYFDAAGSLGDRVRADYRQTVSDLMDRGFTRPFAAWSHAHGVKMKFQAHGGPDDLIQAYGAADISEVESLGGNAPLTMRLGRSAADIYGRTIVSSESLGYAARPYSPSLDDMRKLADVNFAGGANRLMYHGYSYRLPNRAWPGWHAFQPGPGLGLGFGSMINEGNPLWVGVPALNAYVARTQAVLQQGRPIVPVAYYLDETGSYDGSVDDGAHSDAVSEALMAGGYDFDRVNPEGIGLAQMRGGALVTPGGMRYGALVLPRLDGIRAESAERIAAFAKAGLPILFVEATPGRDVTLSDSNARDRRVKAAIAAMLKTNARVVPESGLVGALRARKVPGNLTFTAPRSDGLAFVQRRVGDRTVTFLYNSADEPRDAGLNLPRAGGVSLWNGLDGIRRTLATSRAKAGVTVPLRLAARGSALLVQDPRTPVGAQPSPQEIASVAFPVEGWSLSASGHGTHGAVLERAAQTASLGDWSRISGMADFSGEATYRRSFAAPPGWLAEGNRVFLDLGEVHDMAIVSLNGRRFVPKITAPFRVELTAALRAGQNELAIAVFNSPNNAMIDPQRIGFKALTPVPAGLVGPVRIQVERSHLSKSPR